MKHSEMKKRFQKIVDHVVGENSPTAPSEISTERQADAIGGQGKKPKLRPIDQNPKKFK